MNWPISARRLVSASLFSTAFLLAATSCEKASDLGVDLPGTSATNTEYRDFPVTASTILQDSLETLKANSYLLGRVRDNALGTTAAKGYFNLRVSPSAGDTLPASVAGTAANPQLDSLVLVMPFASVYGSATRPLQVNVYPLVAPLDEQGLYNSTSSVAVDMANPLGTGVQARLNGVRKLRQRNDPSSVTDTTTFKIIVPDKTVRLKLNSGGSSLANTVFTLLKNTSFSQTQLDAAWKGVSVQPTDGFTSAVVGFPATAPTRVVVYYHYTSKVGNRTLKGVYSLPFGTQGTSRLNAPRYFTGITTDLTTPFTILQGPSGSSQAVASGASGDMVYAQAGSGISAKLEIPGLAELKTLAQPQANGTPAIAINRAELILPVQPYTSLLFGLPDPAYLYEVNASNESLKRVLLNSRVERLVLQEGINQLTPGVLSIGNSFNTGGAPTGYYQQAAKALPYAISDINRSYSMLMTGYVQAYVYDKLSGVTPAAFVLSPTLRNSGALGLERAVFDGKNIKLRVYYSRLR